MRLGLLLMALESMIENSYIYTFISRPKKVKNRWRVRTITISTHTVWNKISEKSICLSDIVNTSWLINSHKMLRKNKKTSKLISSTLTPISLIYLKEHNSLALVIITLYDLVILLGYNWNKWKGFQNRIQIDSQASSSKENRFPWTCMPVSLILFV